MSFGSYVPLFSPLQLFAAGGQGAWHEPRQTNSLYQTIAGQTAVITDNDPVGLVLGVFGDGPELVSNGTFETGITGWTYYPVLTASGSVSFDSVNKRLQLNRVSGIQVQAVCSIVTDIGATYKVNHNSESAQNTFLCVNNVANNAGLGIASRSNQGPLIFTAEATTTFIQLRTTNSASVAYFDNVTVKKITGFGTQATSTARPTYKTGPARLVFDADPDSLTINFESSPGISTVAYGVSGGDPVINAGVNISGTTYTLNPTNTGTNLTGLVIINRALTPSETAKLTTYLRRLS